MELPRFLLADNSDFEDAFVLHTEFPRFLINVNTDEVEWYDDVEDEDTSSKYGEPDIAVIMFLTAINANDFGTEREIKLTSHAVKLSEENIAYIRVPGIQTLEEIKQIERYVKQLCE